MKDCGTVKGKAGLRVLPVPPGHLDGRRRTPPASPRSPSRRTAARRAGVGLRPRARTRCGGILMGTATDHACPAGAGQLRAGGPSGRVRRARASAPRTSTRSTATASSTPWAWCEQRPRCTGRSREPTGMPSAHPSGRHPSAQARGQAARECPAEPGGADPEGERQRDVGHGVRVAVVAHRVPDLQGEGREGGQGATEPDADQGQGCGAGAGSRRRPRARRTRRR